MRWLAKSLVQNVLALLPDSYRWNYWFQRRVSKSVPLGAEDFQHKIDCALHHAGVLSRHVQPRPLDEVHVFEFGAGWDLIIPLCLSGLGVRTQTVIDLSPLVRMSLVRDAAERLSARQTAIAQAAGRAFSLEWSQPLETPDQLEAAFGIRYLAPRDARDTGLPEGAVDFISTTEVLEHVPIDQLQPILRECRRILASDGVASHIIDMEDHYSYRDPHISGYNFLRFSDRVWRVLDSPLQHQNRLRLSDYEEILQHTGWSVIEQHVTRPSSRELEALSTMRITPRFRERYSLEALAARSVALVVRPTAAT